MDGRDATAFMVRYEEFLKQETVIVSALSLTWYGCLVHERDKTCKPTTRKRVNKLIEAIEKLHILAAKILSNEYCSSEIEAINLTRYMNPRSDEEVLESMTIIESALAELEHHRRQVHLAAGVHLRTILRAVNEKL